MMKLFDEPIPSNNLLPYDGIVEYYGVVFGNPEVYYKSLIEEINWQHDQALIFGKLITTKRKVAWHGDEPFEYKYSGIEKIASPWNSTLLHLKQRIEQLSGDSYNSCLLNLYHDGSEGMSWHSDAERDLKKQGSIASVTFGAPRKFSFKHKYSKQRIDILLEDGSLLIMKGTTQDYWLHQLPPTTKVSSPRINLTFRTIENSNKLSKNNK
ncbi:alpha-ketoglutarate-dependent dioxygenase AlkB family protein [Sphingobacterium rhinopitheci]|uniref:alpha-ketoglutarate-dependent dioxygenase AlkB family protein n=1 Tax=Sphingobacterium rhinopitheci TaxID=2781960 RepID=UPI00293F50BB|nr:alpha-ketoglutarate-dependent dioxygenase AlkB [Sphingobacterium rhinopitheci]